MRSWRSREPYEVHVEAGGLLTERLLHAFGGAGMQLLCHGKVHLLSLAPWLAFQSSASAEGCMSRVMPLNFSGGTQVGPAVDRLVLPGQEDSNPENDKELHVCTGSNIIWR